jgi:hypothetical protein
MRDWCVHARFDIFVPDFPPEWTGQNNAGIIRLALVLMWRLLPDMAALIGSGVC